MAFGTQTEKQERERERERRGNDKLDDQFCYCLEAASRTSFLSRSCEKALYNSESAKKIFGRCFGFFFLVFLFLYQSGSLGEGLREGGREEEMAGGELDNGVTTALPF